MDALGTLFDDALLDDYEEAMDTVEPVSAETALENQNVTPVPTSASSPTNVQAPSVLPAPAIPPASSPTNVVTPPSGVSSSVAASPCNKATIKSSTSKSSSSVGTPVSNTSPKKSDIDRKDLQCRVCSGKHPLRACSTFRKSSHARKLRFVLLHHYCSRCLAHTHQAKDCLSTAKCRHCNGNHNSTLHAPSSKSGPKNTPSAKSSTSKKIVLCQPEKSGSKAELNSVAQFKPPSVSKVCSLPIRHIVTFSPTLVVQLLLPKKSIPVRAALDPCCNSSYICENLVHNLRLPVSNMDGSKYCRLTVGSSYEASQKISFTAKVTRMKGVKTPTESVSDTVKESFAGFQLADPTFYVSGRVALVLGPEVSPQILKGKVYSSPGLPLAQYTMFGWVISGQFPF